ncbi:MAG: glycoside hydrolase family 2, partial [Anaerolineae bacterium]|nr:glycoside hydrolase family 2 [Anaerolineae bacterium]
MPPRPPQETTISLNGTWQLHYRPTAIQGGLASWQPGTFQTIAAEVPGNVECDLMRAGLLPDLAKGNHIFAAIPLEAWQWNYERQFSAPDMDPRGTQRIWLVFEGVDCLATVWLNGQRIGTTENMLIPHAFDITDTVVEGENTLNVCFEPAVLEGRTYTLPPLDYALPGKWEAQHIRKAAHMYGWDIMPRIVSAGLWRGVTLEIRNETRFDYVYWATQKVDVENKSATLAVNWQFSTQQHPLYDWKVLVRIQQGDRLVDEKVCPVSGTRDQQRIQVDQVDFWWPNGYGDPALYDVTLRLVDKQANVLAEDRDRIGVRTIFLKRTESTNDEPGVFVFVVNGVEIYARGTNWVPLDALHSRDSLHLPAVLPMLTDLQCNMVRCWGGNVYEDHDFFNFCDENGIMVWQDFALACNRPPQTADFATKMKQEARTIILKLRNHPSLALWCGSNENDVALGWIGMDWIAPSADVISRQVLPKAVEQHDPYRSYLPSSPYISDQFFHMHTPRTLLPEDHLWGPRGYFKDPFYTATQARFVSEAGYHGCPSRETLEHMLDAAYVYPWQADGTWN